MGVGSFATYTKKRGTLRPDNTDLVYCPECGTYHVEGKHIDPDAASMIKASYRLD